MRHFYYRTLIEDGLVRCDLYHYRGVAVGFIAYTKYPSDFMARGLRRHWFYLAALMAGLGLRHPKRLAVMLRVLATMKGRGSQGGSIPEGEALSFGVLPEYRSSEFVRRTGRRISRELFEHAREYFRREKIASFRLLVEADNREALLFYHAMGGRFRHGPPEGRTVEIICATTDAISA
jgi:ribosomal protein S18 acetylase RimI-like enzyme